MSASNPSEESAQVFRFDQSEALLRNVMEKAAVGMVLIGASGQMLFCNHAFANMLGYTIDECISLGIGAMLQPDQLEGAAGQLESLFDGKINEYRAERRYVRKGGQLIWVLVQASVLKSDRTGAPLNVILQISDIDGQKRAEEALRIVESRWNHALEGAGQGVWDSDIEHNTAIHSRMWRIMRGMEPDEVIDTSTEAWLDRVHPDDRQRVADRTELQNSGAVSGNSLEYRERRRDGRYIWIFSRGQPVEWMPDGSVKRMVGTDTDITALKEAEAALAEEKERLRVTLQSIGDGVISTDAEQRINFINPAAEAMTGWTLDEAMNMPIEDVFIIVNEANARLKVNPVAECLDRGEHFAVDSDLVLVGRNEQLRDIRASAAPLRMADGKVIGAVLAFQDVTPSRTLQKQLAHSASHDALTGLPNRPAFERALLAARQSAEDEKREHALCYIDLDDFKAVNDGAGHAAGDLVLQIVAQTIRKNCRSQDFAARLGGDEFALLLSDCSPANGALVCKKLIDAIAEQRFPFGRVEYRIGASIGITAISGTDKSAAALSNEADAACYAAKAAGRGRVILYDPEQMGLE